MEILEEQPKLKNAIFTIHPYKDKGVQWVFDDEATGLVKEAFVGGADTLLDKACQGKQECVALFSLNPFKGYDFVLNKVEGDEFGTTYYCEKHEQEAWLCPALFLYLNPAPQNIYVQIKTK